METITTSQSEERKLPSRTNKKSEYKQPTTKTRENAGDQGVIGFSFASDWWKRWREFSWPITGRNKAKAKQSPITYDILFKIALFSLCFSFQMFVLVLFWFQLYNGFSGSNAIDDLSLILFNLAFTTVPPVICGVLDKDVPDLILTANPSLYKTGQKSKVQISRIQLFFLYVAVIELFLVLQRSS